MEKKTAIGLDVAGLILLPVAWPGAALSKTANGCRTLTPRVMSSV